MNKVKTYAINGAIIGGISNAFLNIFNQLNNQESSDKFNWSDFLIDVAKGCLIGGATGGIIGAVKDYNMDSILLCAGGMSGFIKEKLSSYEEDTTLFRQKAQQVALRIYERFGNVLNDYPHLSGSIIKGTAIIDSDIDMQLMFNRDSGSIEGIFETLSNYFEKDYDDNELQQVRIQKSSIGLFFKLDGQDKRIDIVPKRAIRNGEEDAYLFVNDTSRLKKTTIKKTNREKQMEVLKFTPKQKKIIKLLKGWKLENKLEIKSIYIEFLVKKAFIETEIPRGLDKSLLKVIEYIAHNITIIKIIDPANSNNIISDILSFEQKKEIQDYCFRMLYEIEQDERNILDYFYH